MAAKHVLIVEDTELLRRMYQDHLMKAGFEVSEAPDGAEALALIAQHRFDLILLDLIMPRMGGIQVLETIKHDPRTQDIPVIVLTNLGEEATIQRAVELGALDYLIKNETRPAGVVERVLALLEAAPTCEDEAIQFLVYPQTDRGDIDCLVDHAGLKRRLWCPACENELALELVPDPKRTGWYETRFICPSCGRTFSGSS
ncbi:MAG: response regulator [Coriobacteriia bacterium]|nr:response regulator [Coriobacteriia bacterium]